MPDGTGLGQRQKGKREVKEVKQSETCRRDDKQREALPCVYWGRRLHCITVLTGSTPQLIRLTNPLPLLPLPSQQRQGRRAENAGGRWRLSLTGHRLGVGVVVVSTSSEWYALTAFMAQRASEHSDMRAKGKGSRQPQGAGRGFPRDGGATVQHSTAQYSNGKISHLGDSGDLYPGPPCGLGLAGLGSGS